MQVTTVYDVNADRIMNLFVSAFEGGSTYWAREVNPLTGEQRIDKSRNLVWWGHPEFFDGEFSFEIQYDNPDSDADYDDPAKLTRKVIANADVQRGLQVMATYFPKNFADVMDEEGDADTGDLFLQCVLFPDYVEKNKEVIYG